MRRLTRSIPLLASGALLVAAAGCGSASEKVSEKAAEKALEQAAGAGVDVDIDGSGGMRIETDEGTYVADGQGNVKIETEDGTYTAGGTELPDSWPADVPLPDGVEIQSVSDMSSGTGVGLTVVARMAADPAEAVDEFAEALAGWETGDSYESAIGDTTGKTVQLSDGDRTLTVAANRATGDTHTTLSIVYGEGEL